MEHWADGGATRLDNLVQLCRFHHRAVHEGGFSVELAASGKLTFHWPDGRAVADGPALPPVAAMPAAALAARLAADGVAPTTAATMPSWNGKPVDYAWSVDWLRSLTN